MKVSDLTHSSKEDLIELMIEWEMIEDDREDDEE
jgi:hypothetical protein